MKRLFFVATLLLIAFQSFAGEKIDFSMLKNEAKVNVEYIWDDLTIDGKEVKDWLEYRQAEQPEWDRSEEHTSELQSRQYLVCRLLLEKKKISNVRSQFKTISRIP